MRCKYIMKKIGVIGLLLYCCLSLRAQQQGALCIEDCHAYAHENFPLIARHGLIEKTTDYSLSNAAKGYLPQLALTATATLQTDVTSVPLPDAPTLAKDRYQATLEVNQLIWDGGNIRSQQQVTRAEAEVEKRRLDVDMFALRERVNNLFFGILLLDARLQQNILLTEDLERNHAVVQSYVLNGVANQADLDAVQVEVLKAGQTRTQLETTRKAYACMLSAMIDRPVNNLVVPAPEEPANHDGAARPEFELFEARRRLLAVKKEQLNVARMPRLSLFAQGGYGRPGLNMLDGDFSFFALGGIKLAWNFGSLYTQKNDKKKLDVQHQNVDVQQQTFLYDMNLQTTHETNEIKKIRDMMVYDDQIIALRRNVRQAAEARLANGTITTVELMREVNAEHAAQLDKIVHDVQLLMTIYKHRNTMGM